MPRLPKPYDTEAFSFPPAKDNWKYKGTITYSCAGNPDERNLKTVNIVVEDRAGGVLLDDTMQFKGVEIDARVVWKKASHFTVVIREKGTRGALSRTNYWFDSTKGKFR